MQSLVAGQPYYIEVWHKEGSGGDNLAVAWQGPGITQDIIDGQHLKTIDLLHAPILVNPTADITVDQDSADTVLEISSTFSDIDLADSLTLEVHLNSTPSLVTASFVGTQLTLSYAVGTSGAADISIRAVDGGGTMILDTFELTVEPALTDLQAWRLANFGTIDNTGDAANEADPDGDGLNNENEFMAGTDPKNPNSRLHISAVTTSGSDLVIGFPTISGKTYQVEWSDSLQPDSWSIVENNSSPQENIPGTNGTVQVTDTNGANQPRRFYRVAVE